MKSNIRSKSIRALIRIFCLLTLTFGAVHAQSLVNGDFKSGFLPVKVPDGSNPKAQIEGNVATGWRDESAWGAVSIAYSEDATGGHDKGEAQKMEVRSITQGAAQLVQEMPFTSGTAYHLTAWVKAAAPGAASLMLRQSGSPYAAYGATKIKLTTDWTKVEVTGVATAGNNGLVMFIPDAAGTYWISDVTLKAGQ